MSWEDDVATIAATHPPRPLQVGDRVRHPHYGTGRVTAIADGMATCRPVGMWTYDYDPAFRVEIGALDYVGTA